MTPPPEIQIPACANLAGYRSPSPPPEIQIAACASLASYSSPDRWWTRAGTLVADSRKKHA